MNSSPSIAALAKALNAAQAELRNPAFDSTNPHFKSKFASLVAVREAVMPILQKHGLALTQFPKAAEGCSGVVNRLMHVSGEWLEEECLLPLDKNNAQGAGSAVTYARRYSLQSIAGVVADEDDDGNGASKGRDEPKSDPETLKALAKAAETGKEAFYKAWHDTPLDKRKLVSQSAIADLKAKVEEAESARSAH
jgi:hypothetical protein